MLHINHINRLILPSLATNSISLDTTDHKLLTIQLTQRTARISATVVKPDDNGNFALNTNNKNYFILAVDHQPKPPRYFKIETKDFAQAFGLTLAEQQQLTSIIHKGNGKQIQQAIYKILKANIKPIAQKAEQPKKAPLAKKSVIRYKKPLLMLALLGGAGIFTALLKNSFNSYPKPILPVIPDLNFTRVLPQDLPQDNCFIRHTSSGSFTSTTTNPVQVLEFNASHPLSKPTQIPGIDYGNPSSANSSSIVNNTQINNTSFDPEFLALLAGSRQGSEECPAIKEEEEEVLSNENTSANSSSVVNNTQINNTSFLDPEILAILAGDISHTITPALQNETCPQLAQEILNYWNGTSTAPSSQALIVADHIQETSEQTCQAYGFTKAELNIVEQCVADNLHCIAQKTVRISSVEHFCQAIYSAPAELPAPSEKPTESLVPPQATTVPKDKQDPASKTQQNTATEEPAIKKPEHQPVHPHPRPVPTRKQPAKKDKNERILTSLARRGYTSNKPPETTQAPAPVSTPVPAPTQTPSPTLSQAPQEPIEANPPIVSVPPSDNNNTLNNPAPKRKKLTLARFIRPPRPSNVPNTTKTTQASAVEPKILAPETGNVFNTINNAVQNKTYDVLARDILHELQNAQSPVEKNASNSNVQPVHQSPAEAVAAQIPKIIDNICEMCALPITFVNQCVAHNLQNIGEGKTDIASLEGFFEAMTTLPEVTPPEHTAAKIELLPPPQSQQTPINYNTSKTPQSANATTTQKVSKPILKPIQITIPPQYAPPVPVAIRTNTALDPKNLLVLTTSNRANAAPSEAPQTQPPIHLQSPTDAFPKDLVLLRENIAQYCTPQGFTPAKTEIVTQCIITNLIRLSDYLPQDTAAHQANSVPPTETLCSANSINPLSTGKSQTAALPPLYSFFNSASGRPIPWPPHATFSISPPEARALANTVSEHVEHTCKVNGFTKAETDVVKQCVAHSVLEFATCVAPPPVPPQKPKKQNEDPRPANTAPTPTPLEIKLTALKQEASAIAEGVSALTMTTHTVLNFVHKRELRQLVNVPPVPSNLYPDFDLPRLPSVQTSDKSVEDVLWDAIRSTFNLSPTLVLPRTWNEPPFELSKNYSNTDLENSLQSLQSLETQFKKSLEKASSLIGISEYLSKKVEKVTELVKEDSAPDNTLSLKKTVRDSRTPLEDEAYINTNLSRNFPTLHTSLISDLSPTKHMFETVETLKAYIQRASETILHFYPLYDLAYRLEIAKNQNIPLSDNLSALNDTLPLTVKRLKEELGKLYELDEALEALFSKEMISNKVKKAQVEAFRSIKTITEHLRNPLANKEVKDELNKQLHHAVHNRELLRSVNVPPAPSNLHSDLPRLPSMQPPYESQIDGVLNVVWNTIDSTLGSSPILILPRTWNKAPFELPENYSNADLAKSLQALEPLEERFAASLKKASSLLGISEHFSHEVQTVTQLVEEGSAPDHTFLLNKSSADFNTAIEHLASIRTNNFRDFSSLHTSLILTPSSHTAPYDKTEHMFDTIEKLKTDIQGAYETILHFYPLYDLASRLEIATNRKVPLSDNLSALNDTLQSTVKGLKKELRGLYELENALEALVTREMILNHIANYEGLGRNTLNTFTRKFNFNFVNDNFAEILVGIILIGPLLWPRNFGKKLQKWKRDLYSELL